MQRNLFAAGAAVLVAAGAFAVEVGGLDEIDTEPPKEKPVEKRPSEPEVKPVEPEPAAQKRPSEAELLEKTKGIQEKRVARVPGERKKPGVGVRLGYLAPLLGTKEDFSGGFIYGFYHRPALEGKRLAYELGLDFGSSESSTRGYTVGLFLARAAALYGPVEGRSFYLLGGGTIHAEWVPAPGGTSETAVDAAIDLGAGLTFVDGRIDLRLAYSFLLGSENVPGATCLTVGYTF